MLISLSRLYTRRAVLALLLVFLVACVFLFDLPVTDLSLFDSPNPVIVDDTPGTWDDHPVVRLYLRAESFFDARHARQSKNPDEAEVEYRRRYGRAPPPGFRDWVEYALKHNSPIIDDFDTIAQSVHRFSHLKGREVSGLVERALGLMNWDGAPQNSRVERCALVRGKFSDGCRKFSDPLTALLGDAKALVPDVMFLINFLDEPSILVTEEGSANGDLQWGDLAHRSIAGEVKEACRLRGNSTLSTNGHLDPLETFELPFVKDVAESKDLCRHPEYNELHGFLMSPPSLKYMPKEIPLLSQASPYPFSDILFPSTHYGLKSSLYKEREDRSWRRKKNGAYWAGSSTGGYWSDSNTWRHAHRQRLAALGLHKEERNYTYLRSKGSGVQSYSTAAWDASLFDVSLTKIIGCENDAICAEQQKYFGLPRRPDSETKPFKYRFVFDVDGNSYSGRFYRFLASHSVPLKMSIFREWHDERLVPWLHYIPVSQSLEELPELMRFLATTGDGQRISHLIAEAGREWYFRSMTPVHQGIYLYRLMLELAWLQDESRPVT